MNNLKKEIKVAIDRAKVRIWQEPEEKQMRCDIGGRFFYLAKLGYNANLDDYSVDELAELIADAITNFRANGISYEKSSYYRCILTEICHGVYYSGYDIFLDYPTWMANY